MSHTIKKLRLLRFCSLGILFWVNGAMLISAQQLNVDSLLEQTKILQYEDPDSALKNLEICLPYYEAQHDTAKIIEVRMFLMEKHRGMGEYQTSYDYAWSIIPLVEDPKYITSKIRVYHSLSMLYTLFDQYDKARYYINNAIRDAERIQLQNTQNCTLISELYSSKAWLVTEADNDLQRAEKLRLKSLAYCKMCNSEMPLRYQKMHLAQLYTQMGMLDESNKILRSIEKEYTPGVVYPIHSLLYCYIGNLLLEQKEIDKAIIYYKKCIDAIELHKNHLDIEINVFEVLSNCYVQKGNYVKALEYLQDAKVLEDDLFGSRSSQNKVLFEIKDQHALQMQKKEEEIKNQRLIILESEKQVWIFRSVLFVVIALLVIVTLIGWYRRILHKKKIEQEILRQKKELESQKQNEIIEMKNKELMTSALKLMDRDTLLEDIKKFLQELDVEDRNKKAVKQMTHSIIIDRSKKWQEFELYFNSVNDSYYNALKSEFPELTSTDLKMCALIKLGFSSKEMAQVMSIGVEGINVSRSRIRKKLGLTRNMNLIEYLQHYASPKTVC